VLNPAMAGMVGERAARGWRGRWRVWLVLDLAGMVSATAGLAGTRQGWCHACGGWDGTPALTVQSGAGTRAGF